MGSSGGITAEPPVAAAPPEGAGELVLAQCASSLGFLAPAAIFLGVWIVYPTIYTIIRSFFGRDGSASFVGIDNYQDAVHLDILRDGDQEQRALDRGRCRRS